MSEKKSLCCNEDLEPIKCQSCDGIGETDGCECCDCDGKGIDESIERCIKCGEWHEK